MEILQFVIGILTIGTLSFIASTNRKNIKIRYVIQLIIIEFGVAYFLLNSTAGIELVGGVAHGFQVLLGWAWDGTNFVFGNLINAGQFNFFLKVLVPIVVVSMLIGILQYIKVLPLITRGIGTLLSKINGMGTLESFNAVSSLLVGQAENFLTYKKTLHKLSDNRIYTLAATAMSTVSMSIVGSYMNIIQPKYVVAALILNMLSTFVILHIINPYDISKEMDVKEINSEADEHGITFFEMLGDYILIGFKMAVIIAAMLIGFIALVSMVNYFSNLIFGISFQTILGYIFYPFAWIMGIPAHDSLHAGSIMATKIVTNEFVAMLDLTKNQVAWHLSTKTIGIISIFLVSFANFGSIGIIVGGVKAINEEKGRVCASFGLRLLYGATLVSTLSATIAGIMIH